MNNKKIQFDLTKISDIVFDTGIIVNYLSNQEAESVKWLEENIFTESSQLKIHSHEFNQAEIFYLTCRNKGIDEARKIIKELMEFIVFHNESELIELAGAIKCKFSIALADCFSIATGVWLKCPTLFVKERELPQSILESIIKQFNAKIIIFES